MKNIYLVELKKIFSQKKDLHYMGCIHNFTFIKSSYKYGSVLSSNIKYNR